MSVIYIVLPLALLVVLAAVIAFVWARAAASSTTRNAASGADRGRRGAEEALNRPVIAVGRKPFLDPKPGQVLHRRPGGTR